MVIEDSDFLKTRESTPEDDKLLYRRCKCGFMWRGKGHPLCRSSFQVFCHPMKDKDGFDIYYTKEEAEKLVNENE